MDRVVPENIKDVHDNNEAYDGVTNGESIMGDEDSQIQGTPFSDCLTQSACGGRMMGARTAIHRDMHPRQAPRSLLLRLAQHEYREQFCEQVESEEIVGNIAQVIVARYCLDF